MPLSGDNFNRLAIFDPGPKRHAQTINFSRHARATYTRMNRIGKIKWRCTTRQLQDIALRGKAKDLIGKHFQFNIFKKRVVIIIFQSFGHAGDPFGGINGKWIFAQDPLSVRPMGRYPCFSYLMHLSGTDLHLNPLTIAPRNSGVDRAVTVGFGLANIIFKTSRHCPPPLMDHAQNTIAICV